jgi:hypothetical protein
VDSFPRRLFAWPTEQDGPAWIRARLDQSGARGPRSWRWQPPPILS